MTEQDALVAALEQAIDVGSEKIAQVLVPALEDSLEPEVLLKRVAELVPSLLLDESKV